MIWRQATSALRALAGLGVALATSSVLALGCGPDAEPGAAGLAAAPTPETRSPARQCGGFDASQAAAILGAEPERVRAAHEVRTAVCRFEIDRGHAVVFTRRVEASPEAAEAALRVAADGYGAYARCEPLTDLGDQALYCARQGGGRLLARRDAVRVDVVHPVDRALQRRIAAAALEPARP